MSNSKRNIAASTTEAVILWRDGNSERKGADVNAPISSSSLMRLKDKGIPKKSDVHIRGKSTDTIEATAADDIEVASSREDTSISTLQTSEELCISTTCAMESSSLNCSLKSELWDTIATTCIALNEQANALYIAGQYDSALEALHHAERQRQQLVHLVQSESKSDDRPQLPPALADLVSMLNRNCTLEDLVQDKKYYIYQRSDFDEGFNFVEEMLRFDMDSFSAMDTHADLLQVCLDTEAFITFNIGQVRRLGNDFEEAYKCYKQAIDIMKHTSSSSDCSALIQMLNNFACLSYHRGALVQARDVFTQTYQYATKVHGPRHSSVASALNCLGVLYYHSNDKGNDATDTVAPFMNAIEWRQ